jgi:hypothetical protein
MKGDRSKIVSMRCHGPSLTPDNEKCIESQSPTATGWKKNGYHEILATGDGASYNGIRSWRCPTCFAEHRKRIADLKKQKYK